jgi:hypothetical protein
VTSRHPDISPVVKIGALGLFVPDSQISLGGLFVIEKSFPAR